MLAIDRAGSLKPRFIVRDDTGERGRWAKERLFKNTLAGDLDGVDYGFGQDGPKRFVLTQSGEVVASADKGERGSWALGAGDWSGELRPASEWRSAMELHSGDALLGTIKKGKPPKHLVVCDAPDAPPVVQAFAAFLSLTLWNSGGAEPGLAAGLGQLAG